MTLGEIRQELQFDVKTGKESLSREVHGGYASDLMSDVIANAGENALWVTMQTHQNIVAVASMKKLAGIVLVNGREPEHDTARKAVEESLPVMVSELPAFELVGRLYNLGLRGTKP